uniref:Butyrophilin subfamily 2 member A2 n=1 Tax=Xenopus tropicalis TaxID=8364 RepID=A0A803K397_XENTR
MAGPLLFLSLIFLPPPLSGQFHVTSPNKQLVAELGSNVSLPCTLSPPLSADGLEVRWFHTIYSPHVYLLKDGKEDKEQQRAEYNGRVSLLKGPESGDLTLSLHKVQLSDANNYVCFVENKTSGVYEEAFIQLDVVGEGSLPTLDISLQDSSVLLSFSSSGWYPKPQMQWEKSEGVSIAPNSVAYLNQSDGLFRVESSILLKGPYTDPLYCRARHPITGRDTGIFLRISGDLFPHVSPWAYAFVSVFILMLAGVGVAILCARRLLNEKAHLSSEMDWRKAVMQPVYFMFNPDITHPELSVSTDCLSLYNKPPVSPPRMNKVRFETERCCLGDYTFSSGAHYWEVELIQGEEWAVGVASPKVQRKGAAYMFGPQEKIWCVCRFVETFKALDNTEYNLDVTADIFKRVGVYLNLTKHTVSFYDPTTWKHLYTFSDVSQTVQPFFWLGTRGGEVRLRKQISERVESRKDVEEMTEQAGLLENVSL